MLNLSACEKRLRQFTMNTKDKTSRRSGLMLQRTSSKHGHTGFEDLKNFIKEGSDFAKQIVEIIQERAELEATYSKGVSKLASKLFKASKENGGTVSNAWHFIANDFEQTSEIHKVIAASMLEEIVKPLKVCRQSNYPFNLIQSKYSRCLVIFSIAHEKLQKQRWRKDINSCKTGELQKRKQNQSRF